MPKVDDTLLGTAGLAQLLGLTRRRIEQLTADGVLVREPDGKFRLGPAVRAYAELLKTMRGNDSERLRGEREGLVRVRRLTAELELARLRKELLSAPDVHRFLNMAGGLLSSILRGLPSRAAPALAMRSAANIATYLEREIDAALHAWADVLERSGTHEKMHAAIAGGKPTLGVEWLTAQGIEWAPTRAIQVDYTGEA